MATWKKVIVSGSNISQLANDSNYLTSAGSIDSASHVADAFKSVSVSDATITLTQFDGDSSDVTVNNVVSANSASVLATARSFTTTGDVVLASANFDGSSNFTTTATIQANAVENSMMADDSVDSDEIVDRAIDAIHLSSNAGTAISGAFTSTSASIASDIADLIVGGFDLDFAGDTGGDLVITNAEKLTIAGGTNIATTGSGNTVTINLDSAITADVTGDLTGTADTASYVAVGNIDGTIDISDQTNLAVSDTTGQTGVDMTLSGDTLSAVLAGLDTTDSPTFANLTLTGDLTVQGTRTELNVDNLNVEDPFILLNSGSATGDVGIIFGGTNGQAANSGSAIFYDDSADVFAYADAVGVGDVTATAEAKLGAIETANANPSAAPVVQGVGTIHIHTGDETIWIYS